MPDPAEAERDASLAVQLGLWLSQPQIGFRRHPIHHLALHLGTGPQLTPWLVRQAHGLPVEVRLCGNLVRPTHADKEAVRKFLQHVLALIVNRQKLTTQTNPLWLRHRFTRRRVSPNKVCNISENALER
jgi:hypothetical protein